MICCSTRVDHMLAEVRSKGAPKRRKLERASGTRRRGMFAGMFPSPHWTQNPSACERLGGTHLDELSSDAPFFAAGGVRSLPSGAIEAGSSGDDPGVTGARLGGESEPYQLRMTVGDMWSVRI